MSIALSPQRSPLSPQPSALARPWPQTARWKALSLVALADFVVILDATIVNISSPANLAATGLDRVGHLSAAPHIVALVAAA
jgi:hypothetical protein